ncbi:DUF4062 domain-containing protein [Paenibacillus spiritus]|uniref:DUF4062 domain-containing protein n=1 Tax=Paenibacillus spiritus TaxID=2496557 RepID=A0A5J5FV17_9BACL|nr:MULTISPECIES: DUF4062 domain-containing protein [Paenibacillus]KAA8997227.1 DUF4062 domain-containing protein [Paenibacillus spiritus]
MPKTRIFLSSASQASFAGLRADSFERINALGHEALMYEKNFGAWQNGEDSITKCLRMVTECDVFVLFVGYYAGSVTEHGRSVTHLEFEQALEDGKPILVFVEVDVKSEYLRTVKSILSGYIRECRDRGAGRPSPQDMIANLKLHQDRIGPSLSHVEPYVWVFLHEIMNEEKIFVENLTPGVQIPWDSLLSDMFRNGVEMLRNKKDIETSLAQTRELRHYKGFTSRILPYLKLDRSGNLKALLGELKRSARGNLIVNDFGYVKREIGRFRDCTAVTVYRYADGRMAFVESAGEATSKDYELTDESSYVVLTQKHGYDSIFFREDNNCLYVCLKGGGFVLTFHFPCGEGWNTEFYVDYRKNVEDGMMNTNSELFELAISVLEGVI